VVETGGLENRLALTGYGGSNPSPSAKNSFQDIPEHPSNAINAQQTLGVCVLHHPMPYYESESPEGVFLGYIVFAVGVFSLRKVLGAMSLTDTEIRRCKAKLKPYNQSGRRSRLASDRHTSRRQALTLEVPA
jgi:hypothetical protein